MTKAKNRKWLRLVFILYPIVSVFAFALSPFLKNYINKLLGKISGFRGHIDGLVITPFAINVTLHKLVLDIIHPTSGVQSVFLNIESIKVSIEWAKLWSGVIATDIVIDKPVVALSKDNVDRFKAGSFSLDNLGLGIEIKSAQLLNGELEYIDATTNPQIVLAVSAINLAVSNVMLGENVMNNIWSDVILKADICEGKLDTKLKFKIDSSQPEFALDARLSNMNLVLLNTVFQAYGKFDLHSGILNMHTEVEAKDGLYKGYVEPQIDNLQVLGPEDKTDGILRYMWEGLVGAMAGMLEDHSKDEITARITFEKPFKNPNIHIALAVLEVLGNAFMHSLTPRMRNVVKVDL